MPMSLTGSQLKRDDELIRKILQMETDVKRLWRRIQQLEAALIASGQSVPTEET